MCMAAYFTFCASNSIGVVCKRVLCLASNPRSGPELNSSRIGLENEFLPAGCGAIHLCQERLEWRESLVQGFTGLHYDFAACWEWRMEDGGASVTSFPHENHFTRREANLLRPDVIEPPVGSALVATKLLVGSMLMSSRGMASV